MNLELVIIIFLALLTVAIIILTYVLIQIKMNVDSEIESRKEVGQFIESEMGDKLKGLTDNMNPEILDSLNMNFDGLADMANMSPDLMAGIFDPANLVSMFSQILTNDSGVLSGFAKQFGMSNAVAKPILMLVMSVMAKGMTGFMTGRVMNKVSNGLGVAPTNQRLKEFKGKKVTSSF